MPKDVAPAPWQDDDDAAGANLDACDPLAAWMATVAERLTTAELAAEYSRGATFRIRHLQRQVTELQFEVRRLQHLHHWQYQQWAGQDLQWQRQPQGVGPFHDAQHAWCNFGPKVCERLWPGLQAETLGMTTSISISISVSVSVSTSISMSRSLSISISTIILYLFCIYVYIYIHIYACTYIHIYINIYISFCIYIYMCSCTLAYFPAACNSG